MTTLSDKLDHLETGLDRNRRRRRNKAAEAAKRLRSEAHTQALAAAKRDITDPFTYSRIFSHVMNGIADEFRT